MMAVLKMCWGPALVVLVVLVVLFLLWRGFVIEDQEKRQQNFEKKLRRDFEKMKAAEKQRIKNNSV